jgi:hypothetical protein
MIVVIFYPLFSTFLYLVYSAEVKKLLSIIFVALHLLYNVVRRKSFYELVKKEEKEKKKGNGLHS